MAETIRIIEPSAKEVAEQKIQDEIVPEIFSEICNKLVSNTMAKYDRSEKIINWLAQKSTQKVMDTQNMKKDKITGEWRVDISNQWRAEVQIKEIIKKMEWK